MQWLRHDFLRSMPAVVADAATPPCVLCSGVTCRSELASSSSFFFLFSFSSPGPGAVSLLPGPLSSAARLETLWKILEVGSGTPAELADRHGGSPTSGSEPAAAAAAASPEGCLDYHQVSNLTFLMRTSSD